MTAPAVGGVGTFAGQFIAVARRAVFNTWRKPQAWIPGLFFPLMLAAVYSAQFQRATSLDAFEGIDSFLDFLLPAAILQGVAFAATNGASDLAVDIQQGFFERLVASPVQRLTILIGGLAGTAVWAIVQVLILLGVFLIFGATVKGGVGAVLVLIVAGVFLSLALGSLACALALRTGSEESVQATFPLVFVLIFVSSAFFPVDAMSGWYGAVARRNPITWIIDPLRRLTVFGWDWGDAVQAMLVGLVLAFVASLVALTQLRWRLRTAGS